MKQINTWRCGSSFSVRWSWLILITLAGLAGIDRASCQTSARQAGYLYLSPVPQASYMPAQTRFVLLRFVSVAPSSVTNLNSGLFTVSGANSGPHSGTAWIATDQKTVIFEMNSDFSDNELVTVSLNPTLRAGAAGNVQPLTYQFMVAAPMPDSFPLATGGSRIYVQAPVIAPLKSAQRQTQAVPTQHVRGRKAMVLSNGVSVPSDFPQAVITVSNNPSPGYLFLENALNGVPPYTMMLDNNGLPVWYRRGRMFDFKNQRNGMITWCQYDTAGLATFSAFDQNLNFLRTYGTTNGYLTDGHDLKVLPDGSYYIIAYQNCAVNMGLYIPGGGEATVTETAVQGFTAANELVFQWRCWDNYDIRDVIPSGNTDFAHLNGIDLDDDGNVLVSARHLSEITKINRDSGQVMWHLSGAHSNFAFPNDPFGGTSYQHNISALGNGHYMVFDNGDYHNPAVSRAAEYQIDLTNLTASLVWQFRDSPDKYTFWLGSAQRLPTGNTLMDFVLADYPKAIEVDATGTKQFELSLVPGSESYRAFRFPWKGAVAAPYLIAEPQPDNITLVFNKFGDTNVAYYRIYGGTAPEPTTILAETASTMQKLSSLQNTTYYFRVTAVGNDEVESPFSNEEQVQVNITAPNQNMTQNGDFSEGAVSWRFISNGIVGARWTVGTNTSQLYTAGGGSSLGAVQLVQNNIALIQNEQYVLEFDAWADQSRYILAQLAQASIPPTEYSDFAVSFLTPNRAHYRYVFTMLQSSDFAANLVFNVGGAPGTVYLQNVLLFTPVAGDLNLDRRVEGQDLSILCNGWLQHHAGLAGDLDGNGTVDFRDFSLLGQDWGAGTQ